MPLSPPFFAAFRPPLPQAEMPAFADDSYSSFSLMPSLIARHC
jgi:hypothetical protein